MSKSTIYYDLFSTNIVSTKEFIVTGEKPYNIAINKNNKQKIYRKYERKKNRKISEILYQKKATAGISEIIIFEYLKSAK